MDAADVDLICLEESWGRRYESWLKLPMFHGKLLYLNPGLKRVRLRREYDLFVAHCQDYRELAYINAIDWKDHCRTGVCWIEEMWASAIPGFKHWLRALSQFDYIFLSCSGTVATLSNVIGRSCHWLPGAVDTLRFSPFPNPPARVIDVYSIGRRYEGIHYALIKPATRGEIFYVYDTFAASVAEVYDHQQHRDLFGNVAKRSRYFTVAPGRMDDPVTQGQVEIGFRYYEGAAAGTVMIGQPPDCKEFKELFKWPDVVIPIQPDGSDVITVLNDLDSEPARVMEISRRNAVEALLHHDWIYRWDEILKAAGIAVSPRMTARQRRLKALAELASDTTRNDARIILPMRSRT